MKTLITTFFSLSLLVGACVNTGNTVTRALTTSVVNSVQWMGGFVVNRHLEPMNVQTLGPKDKITPPVASSGTMGGR